MDTRIIFQYVHIGWKAVNLVCTNKMFSPELELHRLLIGVRENPSYVQPIELPCRMQIVIKGRLVFRLMRPASNQKK